MMDKRRQRSGMCMGWMILWCAWLTIFANHRMARADDVARGHMQSEACNAFVNRSQWREAIACLTDAAALDSVNHITLRNRGWVHLQLKQWGKAVDDFKRTLEISPNDHYALRFLAHATHMYGHADAARLMFERLARDFFLIIPYGDGTVEQWRELASQRPDDAVVHWRLGNALYHEQAFAKANTSYQRASGLQPNWSLPLASMALSTEQQGSTLEAQQLYDRALALDPRLGVAHVNIGAINDAKGRIPEALARYDKAIAATQNEAVLATTRINRAWARYASGDPTAALRDLREAFRQEPLTGGYSRDFFRDGLEGDVIAARTAELEKNPRNPFARLARGCAHGADGRYGDAVRDFDAALDVNPQEPLIHTFKAYALYWNGDYAKALVSLGRAIELDDGIAGAYLLRGRAAEQLEAYRDALADYDHVIRLDDRWPDPFYWKARLLQVLGRHREAVENFTLALVAYEDSGQTNVISLTRATHAFRATSWRAQGVLDAAAADLASAIDGADTPADWLYESAEVSRLLEKHTDARRYYRAFLHAGGSESGTADAIARLRSYGDIHDCRGCGGSGARSGDVRCASCSGTGCTGIGSQCVGSKRLYHTCARCNGNGTTWDITTCGYCSGHGIVFVD